MSLHLCGIRLTKGVIFASWVNGPQAMVSCDPNLSTALEMSCPQFVIMTLFGSISDQLKEKYILFYNLACTIRREKTRGNIHTPMEFIGHIEL